MSKRSTASAFLATILSAVLVSSAFAVPTYYEIGSGSSVNAFIGPEPPGGSGLVIQTSLSLGLTGTNFTIDDTQGSTFSFFDIWTNETTVNTSNPLDDTDPKQITATLNFAVPNINSTVGGTTVGSSIIYGLIQWGSVTWNGPVTITVGDLVFDVALSDEIFNKGYFGLNEGEHYGATVEATVTQQSSAHGVPESGSTGMLFGLTLVGVALTARKQIKV